jgi:hypothetical protein
MRAPGPGATLQPGADPLIEAMEPGIDGGAREPQLLADPAGPSSAGDG